MQHISETMAKVLFESGEISKITINRPDKFNALDAETIKLITSYVKKASKDSKCRCIIITGSGGKAFCAGADVNYIAKIKTKREAESFFDLLYKMHKEIEESPKGVIAAINGYCLGGGNELAIACDIRIATIDSIFGQPEAMLGIVPGAATYSLPRIIGIGRAKEMILTGKSISSGKALRMGLVNSVCDKNDLMKNATHMCRHIAACSPGAVASAKHVINKTSAPEYRYAKKAFVESLLSKEGRERTKAFLERKKVKSANMN